MKRLKVYRRGDEYIYKCKKIRDAKLWRHKGDGYAIVMRKKKIEEIPVLYAVPSCASELGGILNNIASAMREVFDKIIETRKEEKYYASKKG